MNERKEYSEECFFNGKLKKWIFGDINSFYYCICDNGFRGDNCEIDDNTYNNI